MAVQGDPVPNPPQHDPVIEEKESGMGRFSRSWMQWLLLLRSKINVINALLVQFSQLTGQGFLSLFDGNFFTRSFQGPMSVQILNADGSTGDPDFRLKGDELSPPSLAVYGVDYLGVQKFFRPPLFESTGVLSGGTLAIVNPTTFSISAVTVGMTDYTVPLAPVRITQMYGPFPAEGVPAIATPATWIGINVSTGLPVKQSSPFTPTQLRTIAQLGAVISNGVALIAVNNLPSVLRAGINQTHDFMAAIGPINKAGNVVTANGVNMQINKSAGIEFKEGANFVNNVDDPHNIPLPALAPANFNYRLTNGTTLATTNIIDAANYENPLGTVTPVPAANNFTIQRIYVFTSNLIRIQYGQFFYNTMAQAEAALTTEPFVTDANIAENGLLLCFLIVEDTATDLSNPAQAKFVPATKFGGPLGSGGTTITNTDSLPEGVVNLYFTNARAIAAGTGTFQPLDATLSALAGNNWAANSLPIGSGADTVAQVTFDANTFPARSSVGNLVAKPITDFAFTFLDDANGAAVIATIGAEPAIAVGNTGQMWRGDKVFSNEFFGSFLFHVDGTGIGFSSFKYANDGAAFQYRSHKARGTLATPLAITTSDALFNIQGRGYFSTGGVPTGFGANVGDASLLAMEPFTNTNQGTSWNFSVTALGATVRADRFSIQSNNINSVTDNVSSIGTSVIRWSAGHVFNTHRYGSSFDTGVVSMAALGANVNDWVVTNLANIRTILAGASGAARTITGIAGFASGQTVRLVNTTAIDLILAHDSASSAVGNRFACPNSAAVTINGNDSVELWFDTSINHIRVLGL